MTRSLNIRKSIRPVLFFLSLLFIFAPRGAALSLSIDAGTQFGFAETCFKESRFQEALSEYRRFLFFFPEDARRPQALYRMGGAAFNLKDYNSALGYYKEVFETGEAVYAFSSGVMMARCCQAMGKIDEAVALLDRLIATTPLPRNKDLARYEKGWLFMERGDVPHGRPVFLEILPENQALLKIPDLLSDIDGSPDISRKKPLVAGALSLFPGAGYLYCERYQDALFSFLVNAALICASLEAFDHDLPAIGGIVAFTAMGFYGGNMVGAMGSARKFNEREKNRFFETLLQTRKILITIDPAKEGARLDLEMAY
jgi:tetratricopeptide (TPR) repeat protein